MAQASGSRHAIGYVPETTFGQTPATPTFRAFRHVGTTLNLAKNSFGSEELRSDRMIADHRSGTRSVEGNITAELSADSHDDMLAGALCGQWDGDVLKAAAFRHSYTIERHFSDVNQYLRYRGMQVDTLQLTMNTGAVVGMVFGYWGQSMEVATAAITDATYDDPTTTPTMDAISGEVREGGSPIAVATEVTLNLSNGLNPRFVIGSAESLEPSIGRSNLTGTLSAYFETASLYNKFLNDTYSSLAVVASDGTNEYEFLIPRLKYTGGDIPVSGEGPVSISMPFQALLDPVTGTNFQITRNI